MLAWKDLTIGVTHPLRQNPFAVRQTCTRGNGDARPGGRTAAERGVDGRWWVVRVGVPGICVGSISAAYRYSNVLPETARGCSEK